MYPDLSYQRCQPMRFEIHELLLVERRGWLSPLQHLSAAVVRLLQRQFLCGVEFLTTKLVMFGRCIYFSDLSSCSFKSYSLLVLLLDAFSQLLFEGHSDILCEGCLSFQ
jgi:hypothetical protein